MAPPPKAKEVLETIASYLRLPFASDSIPGAFAEEVIAHVYGADVLRTYDFADVVSRKMRVGWQVKSTKASTPVTWKRAKIPNADRLIKASFSGGKAAVQALGDAVIDFCNHHAEESLRIYDLDEIRYSRIICDDDTVTYFERQLISKKNPQLFDPSEFSWKWSEPKNARAKEQLRALHGTGPDGTKWFAAHLLGENQLHFSGESKWWPRAFADSSSAQVGVSSLSNPIPWADFIKWLRSA